MSSGSEPDHFSAAFLCLHWPGSKGRGRLGATITAGVHSVIRCHMNWAQVLLLGCMLSCMYNYFWFVAV